MQAPIIKPVPTVPRPEPAPEPTEPAAFDMAAATPAGRGSGRPSTSAVARSAAVHGAFVPLLLSTLALLGWLSFQSVQLWMDREALQAAHAGQQQTVDNAGKLRASLDALAADTQRMADAGNPNARVLVEELRKRGVTINSAAAVAPGGAATPSR